MAPTTSMLTMALLAMGIGLSHELCFYNNAPYPPGSFWQCSPPPPQPSTPTVCECQGNTIAYHSKLGHCRGQGDVHYHSFDNKPFDFQGVCRYVLSRDCCGHAFSIAIQQERWLHNSATAITEAFTLRFANYVIELAKTNPRFRVFHNNALLTTTTPFDNADLRCEMQSISIFITLKNIGVWFKWDFNWVLDLWVKAQYKTRTCGICGDFNGNPHNDLDLTPTGDPVTNIRDWGISWRTLIQPSRCSGGHEPPHGRKKRAITPRNVEREYETMCRRMIMSQYFAACRKRITITVFIQNCVVEMVACKGNNVPGCMGFGLGSLIKACNDIGERISNAWKVEAKCRDCRFKRLVYEHWMKWVDACHTYQCRNGRVVRISSKCCIFGRKIYQNGVMWRHGCQKLQCRNGTIIRISSTCCVFGKRTYMNGATWQTRCHRHRCVNGRVISVLNGRCGCMWIGKRVPSGTVKYHGCYQFTCRGNKWVTRRLPCCYHRGTAKYYRTGSRWKCKDFRSGCCKCLLNRIVDCEPRAK